MDKNLEMFVSLTKYIHIAHHIHGRVRLKLDIGVLNEPKLKGQDIESLVREIPGVVDVSLNRLAKSATVTYDKGAYTMEEVERLINGDIPQKLKEGV